MKCLNLHALLCFRETTRIGSCGLYNSRHISAAYLLLVQHISCLAFTGMQTCVRRFQEGRQDRRVISVPDLTCGQSSRLSEQQSRGMM